MVIRRRSNHSNLFRDLNVFEFDYRPEIIHHRDGQLKEIAFAVHSVDSGYSPTHTLLRGPTGTGKTVCIQKIFDEVKEDTRTLIPIYVNAAIEQSVFNIYQTIAEKVTETSFTPNYMAESCLFQMIGERLEERDVSLCLCLDDADTSSLYTALNGILSDLLRVSNLFHPGRIGIFLVVSSMNFDLSRSLSPSVSASLQPHEVRFDPYSREAVYDILHDRVEHGLLPGVISDDVLEVVVRATEARKDIRLGIDLILRAVNHAEDKGRETVTTEDLFAISEDSRTIFLAHLVQGLPSEDRRILKVLAEVTIRNEALMHTPTILYELMKGALKFGKSAFYRRLSSLQEVGIITYEKRTDVPHGHTVVFKFSPVRVITACEGVE
jgi:cell division control protein 6